MHPIKNSQLSLLRGLVVVMTVVLSLSVSFVSDSLPGDRCDWHVSHEAFRNRFHVRVNLKAAQIKLQELVIPEAKGPKLSEAK